LLIGGVGFTHPPWGYQSLHPLQLQSCHRQLLKRVTDSVIALNQWNALVCNSLPRERSDFMRERCRQWAA
jgi:hypothetical protein